MYRLPDGYQPRVPVPFIDEPQGREWQPHVLDYAAGLADLAGQDTIVDLGCGFARKLLAVPDRFRRIGADLPEILDRVRHIDGIEWIDLDLTSPLLPQRLAVPGAVVVCSDVIEHLYDPAPLGRHLASLAQTASAIVVTSPDRERSTPGHLGPPDNDAHAREWSATELAGLLADWGLDVVEQTWTLSVEGGDRDWTTLVTIQGEHR